MKRNISIVIFGSTILWFIQLYWIVFYNMEFTREESSIMFVVIFLEAIIILLSCFYIDNINKLMIGENNEC